MSYSEYGCHKEPGISPRAPWHPDWFVEVGSMSSDSAPARTPETRFSDRVENYVNYRPGYPTGILHFLRRTTGLSEKSVVADVGSGTGISTALLLESGATVHAVEPNRGMREAAEGLLAGKPGFHSVDGSAERTGLPDQSMDLVTAFQAFHWFAGAATRTEFDRILKPEGHLALIWNVRRLESTPFLRAYEKLLLSYGNDYAKVRHENIHGPELRAFFRNGRCTTHSMPNHQTCNLNGLKGRLLSSSYIPKEGHPTHSTMIRELEQIFATHQQHGQVTIEYDTEVFLGA